MFDVGALIFKIQSVGQQVFERDMSQADQAVKKVEGSAKSAKTALEGQGKATDETGKKARAAKGPLDEQAKSTKRVGDESDNSEKKQRKQSVTTEQQTQAARELSTALLLAGAAVGALVTLSVVKYAQFDQAMSNVRAATMATAEEQQTLSESALKAGADTAYSASEAAAAQEELAKAGLTVTEIVGGGLNGALALAAAGQLAVARSAEIMATVLKQYKLPAEDAAHVSDLLAAGAGKAQGSVEDLSLALTYVGPVAAGLGISIEETAGTLAYFAEQGILGERAGTGLRGVIMSLTAPSAIAARTMGEYGIEIFDAQGNMKSLAGISEILKARLGGLTEAERSAALGRIFGNEQITAARILYTGGAKAIEDWTEKVNDSGYAAEQAAIRQNNLAGDIEKLGGAMDTALIQTGSGANDVLRDIVQTLTFLVDGFGEADPAVQQTVLTVGAAVAAFLLLTGGVAKGVIGFKEMKRNADLLNLSLGKTTLVAGGAAIAITGILAVVIMFAQRQAEAEQRAQSFADTLEEGTRKITKSTKDLAVANLQAERSFLFLSRGSSFDAAGRLGADLNTVAEAALGSADALDELSLYTRAADGDQEAFNEIMSQTGLNAWETTEALDVLVGGIREQTDALGRAKDIEGQKNQVTETGVQVTKSAADAYLEAADGAADLDSQIQKLIDSINEANGIGQDAVTTNAEYREAIAGITAEVESQKQAYKDAHDTLDGFTLSLDQSTTSGSANAAMLANVAKDAIDAAQAQFELDKQTISGSEAAEKYAATLAAQRQEFIDTAAAAGFNADEVSALADQIFRLPSEKEIEILANTVPARSAIDGVIQDYQGRTITLRIGAQNQQTYTRDGQTFYEADGGKVEFYANGGRSEHHIAQFARAGTMRVWAEPETAGEWYLPNATTKRARSLVIAERMLNEWGFDMVPRSAASFANGTPVTNSSSSRGGDTYVDIHAVPLPTARELLDLIDQEAQWASKK